MNFITTYQKTPHLQYKPVIGFVLNIIIFNSALVLLNNLKWSKCPIIIIITNELIIN